jgi:isoquinoline 1-oxidoreductase alpha subunit
VLRDKLAMTGTKFGCGIAQCGACTVHINGAAVSLGIGLYSALPYDPLEVPTMITLTINGQTHNVEADESTPLLWVLRDKLAMTGTKFGCGIAQCGACTVHINGAAARACVTPVGMVAGAKITTIEGLSTDGSHPVQQAWIAHEVPQCGYCQPGMMMAAAALLTQKPNPTDADIDAAITNICRCGTYPRVRAAIHSVAKT